MPSLRACDEPFGPELTAEGLSRVGAQRRSNLIRDRESSRAMLHIGLLRSARNDI
jgi:hypothetical protein